MRTSNEIEQFVEDLIKSRKNNKHMSWVIQHAQLSILKEVLMFIKNDYNGPNAYNYFGEGQEND